MIEAYPATRTTQRTQERRGLVMDLQVRTSIQHRSLPLSVVAAGVLALAAAGCGGRGGPTGNENGQPSESTRRVALTDMTPQQSYLGFAGGLYPGGSTPPAQHDAAGRERAHSVVPLDVDG